MDEIIEGRRENRGDNTDAATSHDDNYHDIYTSGLL